VLIHGFEEMDGSYCLRRSEGRRRRSSVQDGDATGRHISNDNDDLHRQEETLYETRRY
jgi:hypothetical protein